MTIGEHRDGEFVKFMRWQKKWSERLNSDGNLGDPSAFWCKQRSKNTSNKIVATSLFNIHVDQRNVFTNPLEPDAVYFCTDAGVYIPPRQDL